MLLATDIPWYPLSIHLRHHLAKTIILFCKISTFSTHHKWKNNKEALKFLNQTRDLRWINQLYPMINWLMIGLFMMDDGWILLDQKLDHWNILKPLNQRGQEIQSANQPIPPWRWRHDEWPFCPASLSWASGVCLPAPHLAKEEVGNKGPKGWFNVDTSGLIVSGIEWN